MTFFPSHVFMIDEKVKFYPKMSIDKQLMKLDNIEMVIDPRVIFSLAFSWMYDCKQVSQNEWTQGKHLGRVVHLQHIWHSTMLASSESPVSFCDSIISLVQ